MLNVDDITTKYKDILTEIGNIGGGKAATSLSDMLNVKVLKTIPEFKVLEYETAMNEFGRPDTIVASVLSTIAGGLNGFVMYIADLNFAKTVIGTMIGREIISFDEMNDIDMSLLKEVGNILISSYISAIAEVTQKRIRVSVPSISVNMVGAILNVPLVEYGYMFNRSIFIKDNFIINGVEAECNFMLIPDENSIKQMLDIFGDLS